MVKKKKNSDNKEGLDSVSHRYIYYSRRYKKWEQEIGLNKWEQEIENGDETGHDGASCFESEKCETGIFDEVKTTASALPGRWMAKKRRSVVRKRTNESLKLLRRRNFKYVPKVAIDVKPWEEVPVKLGKRKKTKKDSMIDSHNIDDEKSASKLNENLIVYRRRKRGEKILSWIDLLTQGPKRRVTKKKAKSALVRSKHTKRKKENMDIVPYKENIETTSDSEQMMLIHVTPKTQSIPPRVALDDRTVKEWEMLMAKPDSESNGGEADEGETEWWRKERDLFDERVASFISNMNRIQGERKFSKWKGSVMDSIGGAYLTQNVHDTLSSSAFISLAAKYPHGASNGTPGKRERNDVVSKKGRHTIFRRKVKKEDDAINRDFLKKYYSKVDTHDDTLDALDWDAVRISKVDDIAKAIATRGMSNNLATRIKNCLNIFAEDLGSTNLEWIRDVPPHEAKEYLLSIPGLGLKSVECIRLLTLLQKAFPIDRNAGRVAVRLGWVPLQPLPEGQEFHLLKEYPKVDDVQKYLWPRLCKHKPSLLYELHCHMITFGKVFCTKINPNCNACPMRAECKHYASALASSHLALPGIKDENDINSDDPMPLAASFDENEATMVPLLECVSQTEPNSESQSFSPRCLQMVEAQVPFEQDIEDFGLYQIPRIKFDEEKMRETVQKFINENILLQEGQLSKSLMILTSEMASIPMPKLKNGKHLRTEHQVYVLPDQHWPDILAGLETRVPEESCPYLLAIWSEENINKDESAPEDEEEKTVSGTLLIPVRTAQRGMFPLNGTYFQANEGDNPLDANGYLRSRDILMDQLKGTRQDLLPNITINKVFADDESSEVPIKVPRKSLWHLPRATLYCGNNISAVCRGMNSHEIQECFWTGYVCFRGFNRKTRDVKPLSARFHLPVSKGRKTNGPEDETNSATGGN